LEEERKAVQVRLFLKYADVNVFFMGQRSQVGSSRGSGRGYGIQRREKAKTKKTKQKHESSVGYAPETNLSLTAKEAAEKTIIKLRKLGKQRFALYPFSEYFDTWLRNLREVLSEFESNPIINPDDQFSKDSLQILSDVESELHERHRIEMSSVKTDENLSENRTILNQLEKEFAEKVIEAETQRSKEVTRLSSVISGLNEKLDSINRMKTGIFRGFSEKAKTHALTEAHRELDSVQRELDLVTHNSDVVQQKLKEDYEKERLPILEKLSLLEKELEDQKTDGSLTNRDNACEALVKTVNSLLERSRSSGQHD
jgi:hypothetical protein